MRNKPDITLYPIEGSADASVHAQHQCRALRRAERAAFTTVKGLISAGIL